MALMQRGEAVKPGQFLFCLLVIVVSGSGTAQSVGDYQVPLTEYGHPDLQGVWNFSSNVPMVRPLHFGTQEFLTPEQIEQQLARIEATRAAADAKAARRVVNPPAPEPGQDPGRYNGFWNESAGIGEVKRTSLIVYPENGRFPTVVEGVERQMDSLGPDVPGSRPVRTLVGGIGKDGPEDRGLFERCLVGLNSGPPLRPSLYNNNVQLIQGRDTAVIYTEMIHDARIVPINEHRDKQFLPDNIRLWSGDSRGWYEGSTLVVETRNFNGLRQSINYSTVGNNYAVVLTERFTRTSYNTMEYEFTVKDPATYTDSVTAILPFTKVAGQIYEFACHEGNYSMGSMLRGAGVPRTASSATQKNL